MVGLRNSTLKKRQQITFLLDTEDDAQHLTWTQLATEVNVEVSEHTVQNSMKEEGFVDGIMKRRSGVSEKTAEKRVERAENQLKEHPTSHDWKNVLFSDEVHFR